LVALAKVQFGEGRQHLEKRIVRDRQFHVAVCHDIGFIRSCGRTIEAAMPLPIVDGDGYREFIITARREAP
jgi:predicted rRNA methylase YqxC with S4 and FtsJ domains